MTRWWTFGCVAVVGWAAVACGAAGTDSQGDAAGGGSGGSGSGGTGSGATGGTDPNGQGNGSVSAGVLTAGAWDDNRNFDFFLEYLMSGESQLPGVLPFDLAEHEAAYATHTEEPGPRETLDVSLVIDTTGSMGDEIRYLKNEFLDLYDRIKVLHPDADQRWSLVVYRDTGDTYVTQKFDFGSDPNAYQATLSMQQAAGGGDLPEAPEKAIAAANDLGWRTDDATARLLFWVADAPHHNQNASAMASAIRAAQQMRIHIYPVASSGVDGLAERSMRSAAQLTGGRYLFLTDDSGIGNSHKEPTVPCYFVTKLNDAVLRMIDIELSGTYYEPDPAEVIRTGGNPQSGACILGSDQEVHPY